jgi:hypothetical protein
MRPISRCSLRLPAGGADQARLSRGGRGAARLAQRLTRMTLSALTDAAWGRSPQRRHHRHAPVAHPAGAPVPGVCGGASDGAGQAGDVRRRGGCAGVATPHGATRTRAAARLARAAGGTGGRVRTRLHTHALPSSPGKPKPTHASLMITRTLTSIRRSSRCRAS